jgi:hypothetical protein
MMYCRVDGFSGNLGCFSIFLHTLRGGFPHVCEIMFFFSFLNAGGEVIVYVVSCPIYSYGCHGCSHSAGSKHVTNVRDNTITFVIYYEFVV